MSLKIKPKISLMVAKKMLIKTRIKHCQIYIYIYKLTVMKTYLRAVGCASEINMAKFDKESIRKEDEGI